MKALRQLALAAALPAMLAAPATAMPKLEEPRPLGRLTVYADDQRPGLFFYGPGELAMATDRDGKPDFHFLQMRYTGTAVHADRGAIVHRSFLTFRVAMQGPTASDLKAARQALGPRPVELRPLPIRRLEASVLYTPIGEAEEKTPLPEGHFEEAEDEPPAPAEATGNAFWTTRSYALGLDPQSSELFSGALVKGQLVLSMSYSFHTKGAERDHIVRSGAFSISLDTGKWPGLLRRLDVNERVPPGYPLLDIHCYDFQDAPPPALYEKQVHVEADGVAGGRVTATARFGRDHPDLHTRSLRFGVAVRLDRPYRYRVTEVRDDGTSAVTPWRERASWAELLDVTTPAVPAEGREPRPAEDP
jgi:hypothetical protein